MKIDAYLSLKCSSEKALRENIVQALALENVEADVTLQRIDDNEALRRGLTGSPSIFIDGEELQRQELVGFS